MKQIFTMDVEQDINAALEFSKLLTKHKIRGEFYIVGALVERYPTICKEIAKHHTIGGHGYFHEDFAKLSYTEAENVIKKTISVFKKNKINCVGWRFPGFSFKNDQLKILVRHKLYDSSISESASKRWHSFIFIRNLFSNIKRGTFFFPKPFPKDLNEKPWSVVDLNDKQFYNKSGRLVTHCYTFKDWKEDLKEKLEHNN
jgi:peptidoglycan/xylan/chitin deacetylase (PgdA/CDA1 family)